MKIRKDFGLSACFGSDAYIYRLIVPAYRLKGELPGVGLQISKTWTQAFIEEG